MFEIPLRLLQIIFTYALSQLLRPQTHYEMSSGRKRCDTLKDEFHSPNKTKSCSLVCSFCPIRCSSSETPCHLPRLRQHFPKINDFPKANDALRLKIDLTANSHTWRKLTLQTCAHSGLWTHRGTCGHEPDTLDAKREEILPFEQQDNNVPTPRWKKPTTAIFCETHSDNCCS